MKIRVVGEITRLLRYPVKSCGAEEIGEAHVTMNGLEGDREFCFAGSRSGTLTARNIPKLGRLRTYGAGRGRDEESAVRIRFPDGSDVLLSSDKCLNRVSELAGEPVELRKERAFEAASLSLVSTQSVRAASEWMNGVADVSRFRPNVVVSAVGGSSFPEDEWVGTLLALGEEGRGALVKVTECARRSPRCLLSNAGGRDTSAEALQAFLRGRRGFLGVYMEVFEPGHVRVGDPIAVGRSNVSDLSGRTA